MTEAWDGKAGAWTSWLDEPPHRYGRVEWVRVRDGRITDCGDTIPATLPPQWNVAGLWWRPCALPGEDRAAWLKGWEAAREAAALSLESTTRNIEHFSSETNGVPLKAKGETLFVRLNEVRRFLADEAAAIRAMEPPKEEPPA